MNRNIQGDFQICINVPLIVARNGKIIQKHGPKGPSYALMLRTKLYQNPFFFTVHQNINKRNSCGIKTVCELPFYLPMLLLSFFFLPLSRYKHARIKLCQKCCSSSKKQISTAQNGAPNQQIIKFFFTILLGVSYKIRASKYYEADTSCVVHVLCGLCTEYLNTLREFSLLFENTMKTPCCCIEPFK